MARLWGKRNKKGNLRCVWAVIKVTKITDNCNQLFFFLVKRLIICLGNESCGLGFTFHMTDANWQWSCPQKSASEEDKEIRVSLSITGVIYITLLIDYIKLFTLTAKSTAVQHLTESVCFTWKWPPNSLIL